MTDPRVVQFAIQYLKDAAHSPRLSMADRARAAALLRDAESQLGGWSSSDREAVAGSRLVDATGQSLDDDAAVRALWWQLLLTENPVDCDRTAQILLYIGAVLEEPLTSVAADAGLSLRVRISALAGRLIDRHRHGHDGGLH